MGVHVPFLGVCWVAAAAMQILDKFRLWKGKVRAAPRGPTPEGQASATNISVSMHKAQARVSPSQRVGESRRLWEQGVSEFEKVSGCGNMGIGEVEEASGSGSRVAVNLRRS